MSDAIVKTTKLAGYRANFRSLNRREPDGSCTCVELGDLLPEDSLFGKGEFEITVVFRPETKS